MIDAPAPSVAPDRLPDISVVLSKEMLRYAVRMYAERHFRGWDLGLARAAWYELALKGDELTLELVPGHVHLVARLMVRLTFRWCLPASDGQEWRTGFPLELDALAALSVRDDDQLCLHVGRTEVHLTNAPLPRGVAAELVDRVLGMMPSIPVMRVPRAFELPEDPLGKDRPDLRILGVFIDEEAASLGLQIDAHVPRG